MKQLWLALVVLAFWASTMRAQSTFGSILGTAQDQSGAVLPGADIEVTNLDTQVKRTAMSNGAGQYSVLNLLAGRYSLVVSKSGFAATRIEEIVLDARQERRVDLVLGLAATTQGIQVEAIVSAVNTENATVSQTMGNEAITSLPMNYRGNTLSPLGAIVSMPNVQQDSSGAISVGGAPTYMTRYSVDGTNNSLVLSGGARGEAQKDNYPSTEMLSEFKVSAVSNNAEFKGSGDVTITTKSGANAFHGSAFEYLQNAALDAKTYGSLTKQAKTWNTFGGSFSGPIVRNKTFFFADYEGNRKPGSALITGTVPTLAMRNGNLNGVLGPAAVDPTTGLPFPNNQIPSNRISSVATNFFNNYYPLPNVPGASVNNYNQQVATPATTNGYDVRIDQNFGSKNQLFGRWDWKNLSSVQLNGSATFCSQTTGSGCLLPSQPVPATNRNLTLADTHIFTPTLINEFRFGFARQIRDASLFPLKGKDVVAKLGITGVNLNGPNIAGNGPFPGFDFSDGTGFTGVAGRTGVPETNRVIQYVDNVSWVKGKHTMKFGAEVWFDNFTQNASTGTGDDIGAYGFNQSSRALPSQKIFSGNAYADFLLGIPNNIFLWIPTTSTIGGHTGRGGFFAQDVYRVTSSLTVSYGLRYDLLPQSIEPSGQISSFLPSPAGTGTMIYSPLFTIPTDILYVQNLCAGAEVGWKGVPNAPFPCTPISRDYGSRVIQTDYKDFRPRLGVAWRPLGNNKTVFRAGIGLFTVSNSSGGQSYTYSGSVVPNYFLFNGPNANGNPTYQFPQAPVVDPSTNAALIGTYFSYFGSPTITNHPMTQWNAGIEQELPGSWVLHLNYIGSAAAGLPLRSDYDQVHPSTQPFNKANKPFPNFGQLSVSQNQAFSNYEAFNPAIEHRYAKGLSLRADYTWAKSLGTAGGENPSGFAPVGAVTDRFSISSLRGNNAGIRRHRFLLTGVYDLPFGKGKTFLSKSNAIVDGILGGWRLSTVTLVETGPYLTPTISCALSATNANDLGRGQVICRPDRIADPNLSDPTPNAWWNIKALVPTPANAGRIGNAGIGILEGPGTVAVSGGLSKSFTITERVRLRVEGSFTNLPNHPNFAAPPTNISSPNTFGRIVTTQSAENAGNRVGQLSARIDF